jgi:hypothetical protein
MYVIEKSIIYFKYIMNVLRTIDNPQIGDVFELFVPPDPIWRYALIYNIIGNTVFLRPFDMADPTHCIEEDPATKAGLGLNPLNTHFVRTFEYTNVKIRDYNGVLRYYHEPAPIIPKAAGSIKKRRFRKRSNKKRSKSKKQSFRKRK